MQKFLPCCPNSWYASVEREEFDCFSVRIFFCDVHMVIPVVFWRYAKVPYIISLGVPYVFPFLSCLCENK